jgi:predicted nucleotidyltransferase
VLNNLYEDRRLALAKQDYATATRVDELLGKYRAMFTERIKSEATVSIDNQQSLYNRFQFLQVTPTQ